VIESVPSGDDFSAAPSPSPLPRRDFRADPYTQGRRTPGLFGRWFAPMPAGSRVVQPVDESGVGEATSDPAADTAIKQRIERRIRTVYGDQLRALDVRVAGRDVTINAKVLRFWQRRSMRRSLESLPLLAGYKSTIHVD
jgi:hypothetical protein